MSNYFKTKLDEVLNSTIGTSSIKRSNNNTAMNDFSSKTVKLKSLECFNRGNISRNFSSDKMTTGNKNELQNELDRFKYSFRSKSPTDRTNQINISNQTITSSLNPKLSKVLQNISSPSVEKKIQRKNFIQIPTEENQTPAENNQNIFRFNEKNAEITEKISQSNRIHKTIELFKNLMQSKPNTNYVNKPVVNANKKNLVFDPNSYYLFSPTSIKKSSLVTCDIMKRYSERQKIVQNKGLHETEFDPKYDVNSAYMFEKAFEKNKKKSIFG